MTINTLSRNKADQVIYSTEKTLKEHGDKVSDDERKKIDEAKERLEAAVKTDQPEIINQKIDDLMTAAQAIAEHIYKETAEQQAAQGEGAQAGPQGGDGAGQESEKNDDGEAVDADFEVVDEEKKN